MLNFSSVYFIRAFASVWQQQSGKALPPGTKGENEAESRSLYYVASLLSKFSIMLLTSRG